MKPLAAALALTLTLILTLSAAPIGRATLIGDAHRAIAASYQPRSDGFDHGRITACRRVSRTVVDCALLLTGPAQAAPSCQPGAAPSVVSVGVCEAPLTPSIASAVVTLRVHRSHVWHLSTRPPLPVGGTP